MTRPRPPIGPALAGAVDLSGLKQKAQTNGPAGAQASPPGSTEITEANFEAEVLARSNQLPVVVVLWSPRSNACVELVDTLARLAQTDNADGDRWSLAAVNVDTAPRVAQVFGVDAVPTVVALAGGQPIASFQGVQPADQLRRWLDSLLSATAGKLDGGVNDSGQPEQTDPALAQAREQLESGDFVGARNSYQALLDSGSHRAEAEAALRQIAFLERATTRQPGVVTAADAAPGDIEAAFAAADVQILNHDVSAAFDRLIALVRRTSDDERTAVRTRLVELFELFDPTDPDVIAGRRSLANALY